MSLDYAHYPEFTGDLEDQLLDFSDKIQEGIDWVIAQWEDCIGSKGWMWLVSPAVKIAYELAKDKLEDKFKEIWDAFEEKCEEIWDSVGDLTGDPWQLMEMNQAYVDAGAMIRDEKLVLERLSTTVGRHWEGHAFTAYSETVGEQVSAIAGVDAGISKAATACAQGAQQISQIWADIVKATLDYAGSVVDAIKDGTDAGQWVTLDAGPALKVILDAAIKVAELGVTMAEYWADNATVKTDMWRQLNSGLDGLDANNDWPRITGTRAADMDDKDAWDRG